ncbi:hypothetical protein [Streptosporangium sp. 'caverna']|uniref:hypothetical protein n=1 Tax=Streptosporangium sp. 'caverna' TaxID=2202249 RepID=UPI001EF94D7D|nr:hypothetical protein [Streptosporangium sp. 'caverna']
MIGNVLVAGMLLLAPIPPGGTSGTGYQKGREAGVILRDSQIIVSGDGAGGTSDGYRVKRPCWYEPGLNADDMLKTQRESKPSWIPATEWERHLESLKQFEAEAGKEGRWWKQAYNEADPDAAACLMAMEPYVFVPPGTTPPGGITLAELVDIARAALTVPKPNVRLNPDAKSYVNLGTWVWLDNGGENTRSVTATLPGVMSATVVATQRNITIDPGTKDDKRAEVKEECGPTGTPYFKGATEDDLKCGVVYLRASVDLPREVYELTVTSAWDVAVQDDVVPFAYDPIEASATRDVPVGEVQSTVRKGTP